MRRTLVLAGWPVALVLLAIGVQQRVGTRGDAELLARSAEADPCSGSEALAAVSSGAGASVPGSGTPPAESPAVRDELPVESESPVASDSESPLSAFMGLLKTMTEDPSSPQARLVFEAQYGDLMDELALDPERGDAVRLALQEHIRKAGGFLAGGSDALRRRLRERATGAGERGIREQLSDYLSESELAAYDAYEATSEERALRNQYGMSLGLFAPDLSWERRDQVRDVLVQEALALREDESLPAALREVETLDRAVQRLERMLPPREQEAMTRFLTIQYLSAEMVARMAEDRASENEGSP